MFGFSVAYKKVKMYFLFEMQLLFQCIHYFVVYIVRRSITSGGELSRDLTPGNSASMQRGRSGKPLATAFDLNELEIEPQTSRTDSNVINYFANQLVCNIFMFILYIDFTFRIKFSNIL